MSNIRCDFYEWLNEGMPANFAPSARGVASPLVSAAQKVSHALNSGQELGTGYTGTDAIQVRFGLDPEEVNTLKSNGFFVKGETGWDIDKGKINSVVASGVTGGTHQPIQSPPPPRKPSVFGPQMIKSPPPPRNV